MRFFFNLNIGRKVFVIIAFSMGNTVGATHIVGGEISYTTSGNGTYVVTLTMYKDCASGTAAYPSSISLAMRDAQSGVVLTTTSLSPGSEIPIPNSFNVACVTNVPSFCVSKKVYTGTLIYTDTISNGFVFSHTACCRNSTISNIVNPLGTSMTYKTYSTPAGTGISNSTPVFSIPPTIVASSVQTNTSFSAIDADGDSLYYVLTDALNSDATTSVTYVTNYSGTNPLPSTPSASMGASNGILSANISAQGQYVVAVKVMEYRNGLLLTETQRDYQLNVALLNPLTVQLDSRYKPIGCTDQNNGVIGITVLNASPPVSYLWNNGDTTSSIDSLGPGIYYVTCIDSSGCADSLAITLSNPDSLKFTSTIIPASCEQVANAEIKLNAIGGRGPYTYYIDSTLASDSITDLNSGTYSIIISDSANLCSIDTLLTLPYDTVWNTAIIKDSGNPKCHSSDDGFIELDGVASLNIFWNDGNPNISTRTNLPPDTYSIFITNSNGCSDTISIELIAPDEIEFNTIIKEEVCFGDESGTINLNPTGGTLPYHINWIGLPDQGPLLTNTQIGSYYPILIDNNGCVFQDTIGITRPDSFYVDIYKEDPASCSSSDGLIEINAVGGTSPYSYSLNGDPVLSTVLDLTPTNYSLLILDDNSCLVSTNIQLTEKVTANIYIPNAFTPGNDNKNEKFVIVGDKSCFSETSFTIFDRWGNIVFQTLEPFDQFWNGRDHNEINNQKSIYQYRFSSKEISKIGSIILLR